MKMKSISFCTLVASTILFTGCVNNPSNIVDPIVNFEADPALLELRQISIESRDEMRILAKTIEAKAQESMTKNQHEQRSFQAIHVPEGFEKIVTISFKQKSVYIFFGCY